MNKLHNIVYKHSNIRIDNIPSWSFGKANGQTLGFLKNDKKINSSIFQLFRQDELQK